MKYKMHTAESNEKKPIEPAVQTAEKTDVKEALEILLEGSADSTKRKKPSLSDQAMAFRRRLEKVEEMEATHE